MQNSHKWSIKINEAACLRREASCLSVGWVYIQCLKEKSVKFRCAGGNAAQLQRSGGAVLPLMILAS